ncbi:MAG: acyltransferase [Bacteroides sp.]|nr:acyltransferase [Bacteroides sp.]
MLVAKFYHLSHKIKVLFYPFWNRLKFKLKGVIYGDKLNVYTGMYLELGQNSQIVIGNGFTFSSGECLNPLCRNIKGCIVANSDASISIGDNVGMSSSCIWAHVSIKIGNNVNIGGDSILMDSDAHSLNYLERRIPTLDQSNKINAPIIIEDDVFIGARCIILKGVTIGARSVIGSGSVVTKSIPADCIAAGNPCKVIKLVDK